MRDSRTKSLYLRWLLNVSIALVGVMPVIPL
jgi:hypothetical protein